MTAKDRRDDTAVLVVDLDGTLIRSDTLYETFWAGMAEDWRTLFTALSALGQGRAALKRRLALRARLDPERLPYNQAVLDHIQAWRKNGGRTVLVTAADESLAQAIADHLELFDEVHGSDGRHNLKGPVKARFLVERYGEGGYVYMGDSAADLPVWRGARKAVTVDARAGLRRRVAALGVETDDIASERGWAWLTQLRPHQWLKNVLVFVPLLAAHTMNAQLLLSALLAFAAFSLVSSSGYVLNDLMDLAADRAHPRKRNRPLASGRLPITVGTAMMPMLLGAGLVLAALGGGLLLAVIAAYFVLTTTYSMVLKQHAIADIGTLAALYTLRIIAGGMATGIAPSVWLLAFSMFFFFALAAVKRLAELVDLSKRGGGAAKRRGYLVEDLPLVSQMTTASGYISVLVLALYLNSPGVQDLYSAPWLLWGICLVLMYWISRVVLVAHRGLMDDDPVIYAVREPKSLVCIVLAGLFAVGAAVL
ncbi:UbiA family prenyltransferase [Roseovarius amoyensis]|uniref:UbiA family prenyltransferase n=1 Tax=Roseovarius amoyensis TaxID=2211448 RepID=UPI000DBE6025|nr:UbiA family prenyltransferase [Roseovarius amoyensis]